MRRGKPGLQGESEINGDTSMDWQAQQQQDELRLQQDLLEALDAALVRPLTQDEAHLLAWASGVRPDFEQHHKPT